MVPRLLVGVSLEYRCLSLVHPCLVLSEVPEPFINTDIH